MVHFTQGSHASQEWTGVSTLDSDRRQSQVEQAGPADVKDVLKYSPCQGGKQAVIVSLHVKWMHCPQVRTRSHFLSVEA